MKRKVVAITGGIGGGKSEVAKIVAGKGYATVSCDELAREVADMPQVAESAARLLGREYVQNGKLNRKAVREKVFASDELLARYQSIFFTEIRRLLDERLAELTGTVFVEIPVFDAFEYPWDAVWLVTAEVATRVERAAARDGVSRENLLNIVSRQKICDSYTAVIDNSRDFAYLNAQVEKLINDLKE